MCVCAKSLQSCLTLCDPMDPPGSSVHGILQPRKVVTTIEQMKKEAKESKITSPVSTYSRQLQADSWPHMQSLSITVNIHSGHFASVVVTIFVWNFVLVLFLLDRVKILVPSAEVAKLSGLKILKTSEVRSGWLQTHTQKLPPRKLLPTDSVSSG